MPILCAHSSGLAMKTAGISPEQAKKWQVKYEDELGIPVVLTLEEGVEKLYGVLEEEIGKYR